jgi:hypothetical protein
VEWRIWLIPTIAGVIGCAVGWLLARWRRPRATFWLAAVLIAAAVALILAARAAQGMEGLGYVVIAIFMAAPAALGAALAGAIFMWRDRP